MTEERAAGAWREGFFRAVLIAAMLVCLAWPAARFLEGLMPYWDGTPFLWFLFFASLEGILGERILQKRRITGWGYLASRVTEALLLVIALKFVNYLSVGVDQLWVDAARWFDEPGSFFTVADWFTMGLFLPMWVESIFVGRKAAEIEADTLAQSPPPDRDSPEYYLWLTQPAAMHDRQAEFDELAETVLLGGIILVAASVVVHAFVTSVQALAVPILLYVALGIALLSQAHYSLLHTGWRVQGLAVRASTGRRWLGWTVLFVVIVSLVALLLPTRYAMGPLRALLGVIGIVIQVAVSIFSLLLYLLSWLTSFLMGEGTQPEMPFGPAELVPPVSPGTGQAPVAPPWIEAVLSALFWLIIVSIVGYAVMRFVRDRFDLEAWEGTGEGGWRVRLLHWLRSVWRRWWVWREETQARLARRLAERRAAGEGRGWLPQLRLLRGLSPRDLVRYFYVSVVRRADQAGQSRRPGQTPYEFQESLQDRYPDLEPDLGRLTDAFIVARYSRRPVEEEDAEAVKTPWQRIKAALRRRRGKG